MEFDLHWTAAVALIDPKWLPVLKWSTQQNVAVQRSFDIGTEKGFVIHN
jgi:hypothetical protein